MSNSANPPEKISDFPALLELAVPEVYGGNAFRLLEVAVEATERDLAKRRQVMETATRNKFPVPAGPFRMLPRTPAPDDHEVRECAHAIQDAERRLIHEFLWFWPLQLGQADSDAALRQLRQGDDGGAADLWRGSTHLSVEGPAAKHNLAVLHHFKALEIERELLAAAKVSDKGEAGAADVEAAKTAEAERHWFESYRHWRMVAVEQSFWSRVVARIRVLDDKTLTTGAARRMEQTLPVAIILINARLTIRFHDTGKSSHAQRQVGRIRGSGFAAEAVEAALRIAVQPTRAAIKAACEAATKAKEADPANADTVAERLLEQTARPLALLDLLLPEDNPARIAEHDQVALAALSCQIAFGNKTEKWSHSLNLIERIARIALSTAAKERIESNRKVVQSNVEFDKLHKTCWFCQSEVAADNSAHDVEMYGDVEHEDSRVRWRQLTVKVPRCSVCKKEAESANNGLLGCLGFLLGLGGCATCAANGQVAWGFATWVAIVLAVHSYESFRLRKNARKGITKRSLNEWPQIKQLEQKGWKFGNKPEGVQ